MRWRLGMWWRWLVEPWREVALVVPLVVAVAVPVMVVTAADLWERSARDEVAASAVRDADPSRNGVEVTVGGVLTATELELVDERLRAAAATIDGLEPISRTLSTTPERVGVAADPSQQVRPQLRLLARAGAVASLDVVEQLDDTAGGVWISAWFAEENGLRLGDELVVPDVTIPAEPGGEAALLRIVGLYEPLWSEDVEQPPPPYWQDVPAQLVPGWSSAFRRPFFALGVLDEETFTARGVTGSARWTAPLTALPASYDGLRSLDRQVTRLEAALVGTDDLGAAVAALSRGGRPTLDTELHDTTADAVAASGLLADPLAATRAAGLALGLVVAAAAGVLLAHRSRRTAVLLVSEGVGALGMTLRATAQLLVPAGVGAALGVLAAGGVAAATGRRVPGGFADADGVGVLVAAAAAVALAGTVSGVLSARVLRPPHAAVTRALGVLIPLVVALGAGTAWFQAGRTVSTGVGTVDLVTVGLPVLLAATTASAILVLLAAVLRWLGQRLPDDTSPTAVVLVQRLAAGGPALRGATVALAVGLSLAAFAVLLEDTLAERTEVAVAAIVGGTSQVSVTTDVRPDQVPPDTTVIRTSLPLVDPGGTTIRVLAVDDTTFADVVAWPSAFGLGAREVLELLEAEIDPTGRAAVPVVAISGQGVPDEGAFGFTRSVPFRVVARLTAVPLLDDGRDTLLTTTAALDGWRASRAGFTSPAAAREEGVELPTDTFSERLVSDLGLAELVAATERSELRPLDGRSAADQLGDPDLVAARAALAFLLVLGAVSAAGAAASLLLLAATRRRERALATVMLDAMGLRSSRQLVVGTLETAVVVAIGAAAAVATAPAALTRLVDRFDPSPPLPIQLGVVVPWGALAIAALAVTGLGAVAIAVLELRARGTSAAEVLRGR